MGGFDEIDDLIYAADDALETQFEALERRTDIAQAFPAPVPHRDPPAPATIDDPLADLKQQLGPPRIVPHFLVLCPHCGRKNRVARERAAIGEPRCGSCAGDLVVLA